MSPPLLSSRLARRKWLVALAGAGCLIALGTAPAFASVPEPGQGIPFGQSITGEATYYNNIGTDACGGQIDPTSQPLVAVSHLWFTAADPNNDPLCDGVSVQFSYAGQTFTLPVEDSCAACDTSHIDLSQDVFEQLAPLSQGVISPITWQFVSSSGQQQPSPSSSSAPAPPQQENLAVQQPPPSTPPSTGTGSGCAAAWSASDSYNPGDVVSDNGDNWTSTWWSTGAEPGAPISWDVWTDNGPC
jgi:chitodextrinase